VSSVYVLGSMGEDAGELTAILKVRELASAKYSGLGIISRTTVSSNLCHQLHFRVQDEEEGLTWLRNRPFCVGPSEQIVGRKRW
jgi:hypothetical protein